MSTHRAIKTTVLVPAADHGISTLAPESLGPIQEVKDVLKAIDKLPLAPAVKRRTKRNVNQATHRALTLQTHHGQNSASHRHIIRDTIDTVRELRAMEAEIAELLPHHLETFRQGVDNYFVAEQHKLSLANRASIASVDEELAWAAEADEAVWDALSRGERWNEWWVGEHRAWLHREGVRLRPMQALKDDFTNGSVATRLRQEIEVARAADRNQRRAAQQVIEADYEVMEDDDVDTAAD